MKGKVNNDQTLMLGWFTLELLSIDFEVLKVKHTKNNSVNVWHPSRNGFKENQGWAKQDQYEMFF